MSIDVKFFNHLKHLSSTRKNIVVFDVMTGSLLELDEISAAILEEAIVFGTFSDEALASARRLLLYKGFSSEVISKGRDIVDELRSRGLFSECCKSFNPRSLPEAPRLSSLTLNVSQTCQLNCAYCFASGGDYNNPLLSPLMSKDIGRKAIDFFFQMADHDSEEYRVFFFGGEPLLNWDTIVDLTSYIEAKAREVDKRIAFALTTNAVGLNEDMAQFIKKHRISVLVSIDGDECLHNELRPHKKSTVNSYNETVKSIAVLKQYCGKVCGRSTITSLCYDVPQLQRYLLEAGCDASMHGVVSCELGNKLGLSDAAFREVTHQFSTLLFQKRTLPEIQMLETVKARLDGGYMSLWSCSFSHALSVDSTGEIYACHRLSSNEEFHLGSIHKGVNEQKLVSLRNSVIAELMTGCRSCWARYLCAAACPADNYLLQGSVSYASSFNCYLYLKLYESAIEAKLLELREADDIADVDN